MECTWRELPETWTDCCAGAVSDRIAADETLRTDLERDYPEVWDRIVERRRFMREELGIDLRPEVMPLSTAPAWLAPFWLNHQLACTISG